MRAQLLKLNRRNSTKSERVFAEICKELKIPFRTKVKISLREIDFLIGNYAIEINGHEQIINKNSSLLELGYTPVNIQNDDVLNNRSEIKELVKSLWQEKETQN